MNVIRKATQEDYDRLQAAATRWIERKLNDARPYNRKLVEAIQFRMSSIEGGEVQAEHIDDLFYIAIDRYPEDENLKYERSLWHRCVARALQVSLSDGVPYIAYGYVGYHEA